MKLTPRERRPYVDFLVAHRDELQLGKHYLGWKTNSPPRKKQRKTTVKKSGDKGATVTTPKEPRKTRSTTTKTDQVKAPAAPAKPKTPTKQKAAPKGKAQLKKAKPAVAPTAPAPAATQRTAPAAKKGAKRTAATPVKRKAKLPGTRRAVASAPAVNPVPTPALNAQTNPIHTPDAYLLFPEAAQTPHIIPTFRFLNGDKVQFAVPVAVTLSVLRTKMRDFMVGRLAAEGQHVDPETVWVMLIVQGTDLRDDKLTISKTPLSSSSIVHCLMTPYTQDDLY